MRALVLFCCLILLIAGICSAQSEKPVVKISKWSMAGGWNFIHVSPKGFVNEDFSTGFMFSVRYRTGQKGRIYYQSELMFSGQGYEFTTPTSIGSVGLGYLYFPQIFGVSLHKVIDLQLGLQPGIPLVANADSTAIWSGTAVSYGKAKDWLNPFVFGLTAGIELHPLRRLILGGRLNHPFTPLAKNTSDPKPSFLPPFDTKLKTCWMNVYVGYSF